RAFSSALKRRRALPVIPFSLSIHGTISNPALARIVGFACAHTFQLTTGALEVLACIAFRQPISQAEIDQLFDADKRGLVVKLRDLKLVEEFAGIFMALWPRKLGGIDRGLVGE
ncbi:MAG: SMC-Scp complex subunit ScpB, partial [Terrimicrobiaceae bacterium]